MKFINILKASSESNENVNDSFKSEQLCSYNTGSDINFCDSSFIINKMRLRTTKKRNGPSVKRLDITLSKIKTTVKSLNAKQQTRVKFNLKNNGLNLMEQECDLHEKHSLFVKNRNIVKQKSGSTIMKRIVKQNQYEPSRIVQQVQPVIVKPILNTNKVINSNQPRKNQPSMGLRAYKLKVQNKDEMDICQIQVSKQDQIPFLENHIVIDQVVSSTPMRFNNEKEICNVIGIETSEIVKRTTIKSSSSISKIKKLRSLNANDFFKADNFKFEINI